MGLKNGKAPETKEREETEETEEVESEESEESETTEEEASAETATKVKKVEKKLGKKIPENIIGPLEPTADDLEDRKALAAYRKRVDKKLDSILERLTGSSPAPMKKEGEKTPETPPANPPTPAKEPAWYDRPLI